MTRLRTSLALTFASALVATGCGSGSGGSGGGTTTTTTASTPATTAQLTRPLKPRCGVAQFPAPNVQKAERNGVVSWTLRYVLGPKAPQIAGESSQVTLTELPPGKRGSLGRTVRIAGRDVRFVAKTATSPFSFGTWVTAHAKYIVLDDAAKAKTLRKLVRCLP